MSLELLTTQTLYEYWLSTTIGCLTNIDLLCKDCVPKYTPDVTNRNKMNSLFDSLS